MKNLMPVYRVVSYVLLAAAAFLSIADLIGLLVSLANPSGFLGVFMLTGAIIYTISSFYFYNQGIQKGRVFKKSLRDWIRVNAFVSIAFALISGIQSGLFLSQPKHIADYYREVVRMQPSYASTGITQASFTNMFSGVLVAFVVYCILLLAHIAITFVMLKSNTQLFKREADTAA